MGSFWSDCDEPGLLFPVPTCAATTSVAAMVVCVPSVVQVVAGIVEALERKTPIGRSRISRKNTGSVPACGIM